MTRTSKRMIWMLLIVIGLAPACIARRTVTASRAADPIDGRVALLITHAVEARTQAAEQAAFDELEKLGCAAVPAIIQRMDDRRPLPVRYISLENKSPQAFEAIRQYGPEEVVDALAAILNQLTGQHFEFIYNGASDDLRAKSVAGWRAFLRRTPADRLCSGDSP